MDLMAEIGDINILVGEEVSGTVTAKIDNVPWDVTFQTLLDMKTLGADYNAADGVIRVHTPDRLKGQEEFKAERAETLKNKLALELSVEPILAQLFKLYYIEPAQAKQTLEDLFGLGDGGETEGATSGVSSNLSITVENTTRSIIVRGYKEDLDIIDAVVREIDVRTKQVLIEAFVVEADKTFNKGLGSRIAAMTKKGTAGQPGSTVISGGIGGAATTPGSIALGTAAGTVSNQGVINTATSGIGIIKTFGTAALKVELEALESLGSSRIVSAPSVFTLNNQEARIVQGTEIPYTVEVDGQATIEFKEVALSLVVTPSIIGDGNVLLDILVSNDSPDTTLETDEPAIKTNEIDTKLLITDGDIVVIGGIKIDRESSVSNRTPGLSKVPVVGNLFKNNNKEDELDEMLIFIAPRVVD
jgi:type IV pilus assembly protein PilQ